MVIGHGPLIGLAQVFVVGIISGGLYIGERLVFSVDDGDFGEGVVQKPFRYGIMAEGESRPGGS